MTENILKPRTFPVWSGSQERFSWIPFPLGRKHRQFRGRSDIFPSATFSFFVGLWIFYSHKLGTLSYPFTYTTSTNICFLHLGAFSHMHVIKTSQWARGFWGLGYSILECDAVKCGGWIQIIWRKLLPLFSESHEENSNLYIHLSWNPNLTYQVLSAVFSHLMCWDSSP
jgi:hypothetical protein